MKKKPTIELNFITFVIMLILIIGIVFVIARKTVELPQQENIENAEQEDVNKIKQEEIKNKETKLYSKDVISFDENKLTDDWKIIDKQYGSIIFYVQGPKKENEDGTFDDIRINIYLEKSEMTNEELKKQMLEKSVYSKIEYTKMQEINNIQWMEFEAENKGIKAKILTIMKDGYMYAVEISGEENLYNMYYNEAMKAAMTVQIAERISKDDASKVIYKFDNLMNIKQGGTLYLLTSLNLATTIEKTEQNSNLPEEYKDYTWTGIKYEDFLNEMKKYMTEDVIKTNFSEFINYNDYLFVKDVKNAQTEFMIEEIKQKNIKGNETSYELVKTNLKTYETAKQIITLKLENNIIVVSKFE